MTFVIQHGIFFRTMPVILRIHLSTEPKPSSIPKRNEGVVQLFGTFFHGCTYVQNSFPAETVFSVLQHTNTRLTKDTLVATKGA
jgi:hypothetical protein